MNGELEIVEQNVFGVPAREKEKREAGGEEWKNFIIEFVCARTERRKIRNDNGHQVVERKMKK